MSSSRPLAVKTGVKMLESKSPDAVILDLALLDGYGMDFLKEIRTFFGYPCSHRERES